MVKNIFVHHVIKAVRDAIEKHTNGKWKWKVDEMSFSEKTLWVEGFSIEGVPYGQEFIPSVEKEYWQEGFSYNEPIIWQEGFSYPNINIGDNIVIIVASVVIVCAIIGAFFTGGQSLGLLTLI